MFNWLLEPPKDFRNLCKSITPENGGIDQLRWLSGHALDSSKLQLLATQLDSIKNAGGSNNLSPFRLSILSNGTTDLLAGPVRGSGLRYGLDISLTLGPFGQITQVALDPDTEIYQGTPDAVLIALEYPAISAALKPGIDHYSILSGIVQDVQAARVGIRSNSDAVVILQTVVPPSERYFGSMDRRLHGTARKFAADLNDALMEIVDSNPGDVLLDAESLANSVGLDVWNDPAQWHATKLPFSPHCIPIYADWIARIAAAIRGKSKKCLVLDLDNTLWGGVIGDDGLDGIVLGQGTAMGEAFLAVQRAALALRGRGIVLAVCSKNDHDIAIEAFHRHPEMLLREEHIAVFKANWNDKASNLEDIATQLNIGIDSLVFLDDNPVEREQVRRELPQVAVPELPADPSFFPARLLSAGYFEATAFSEEDRHRADSYRANSVRDELRKNARDLDSFLESLDMSAQVGPFSAINRTRVTQLINKSNQFNLTTRRYTEQEVAAMETSPTVRTWQFRLIDRFGDNGIICIVICRVDNDKWEIDTWLMSCRVLKRGVEQMVLNCIAKDAIENDAKTLIGTFIPSGRNEMVREHYKSLGFNPVSENTDKVTVWEQDLSSFTELSVPIDVIRDKN